MVLVFEKESERMKLYKDLVDDALTRVKEIQPWDLGKQLVAGLECFLLRSAFSRAIRSAAALAMVKLQVIILHCMNFC